MIAGKSGDFSTPTRTGEAAQSAFNPPERTVAILAGQGTEAALSAQRREQSASKLRVIISGLPREKVITEAALSAQKRELKLKIQELEELEEKMAEVKKAEEAVAQAPLDATLEQELKEKIRELEEKLAQAPEELSQTPSSPTQTPRSSCSSFSPRTNCSSETKCSSETELDPNKYSSHRDYLRSC